MRLFPLLLFGFVGVPLAELYVLIEVGGVLGALPTVLLCIATAVLGAALVRAQGLRTMREVREALGHGEVPALAVLEGVVLALAGVLLLTPGLLTDMAGFAALVPPLRRAVLGRLLELRPRPGSVILDGEYRRDPDSPARIKG